MAYKKILTVQDISCMGQCSITVALPILSACGHETVILPSSVLSTHTAGFGAFHVHDLTQEFPAIIRHWQELGVKFDVVYTGYLGNITHMELVKEIFDTLMAPDGVRVVDPAMGDHGKLYPLFDMQYAKAMAELCACADVILPNITEACMMVDMPYVETATPEYVSDLLDKLEKLCPCVVLTGIGFEQGQTGVMLSQNGQRWHYVHEKLPQIFHGTGDVFASSFVGAWQQTGSMKQAVNIAADYTLQCIQVTRDDAAHWYGVKFESVLPELIKKLF